MESDALPDLQRLGKVSGAVQVERGLQAAVQASGEGVQCQAGMPGFNHFGLQVAQAIELVTGLLEDFELVGLSLGAQVGDQDLAILLVGIGVDGGNDRPAFAPEDQVVAFGVALEVIVEVNAPFRVDLVMHADIIPGQCVAGVGGHGGPPLRWQKR